MKNILVMGSGLAGMTAALKLVEEGAAVTLVSPAYSERAQSVMAMGGINAALNTKQEDDSIDEHFEDTMREAVILMTLKPWLIWYGGLRRSSAGLKKSV